MSLSRRAPSFTTVAPLHRTLIDLSAAAAAAQNNSTTSYAKISPGIPRTVHVTAWGAPLATARYVLFYFGGMPASAEEPALHSVTAATATATGDLGEETPVVVVDIYKERGIHLIAIDKPGMGLSEWKYRYSIRNDWPAIVHQVAEHYGVVQVIQDDATGSIGGNDATETSGKGTGRSSKPSGYGVFGVSNGGPHVMACLTHPQTAAHVQAAAMIVGVSDVTASGYFSTSHLSGLAEGVFNSLPVAVTGPLNYLLFSVGSLYLFRGGGYQQIFGDLPALQNDESKRLLQTVISDGIKNAGLGSAVDCQQGLSPMYALPAGQAAARYAAITCPVSLWYGTKDSTVPMHSAEWLHGILPNSTLYRKNTGHGLFFYHTLEVIDDLIAKMPSRR
jgi:pimeloyl-ACP methyl ester carboxylesterase